MKKAILWMAVFYLLSISYTLAHDCEQVHPYISEQAVYSLKNRFPNIPDSFKTELAENVGNLRYGSTHEDVTSTGQNIGICYGTGGAKHPYCLHFWKTLGEEASENSKGLTAIPGVAYLYDGSDSWPSAYDKAAKLGKDGYESLWQRAINEYKAGNKDRAYLLLGKLAHLLQDMTVPAHTHDDVHLPPAIDAGLKVMEFLQNVPENELKWQGKDSYEQYVKMHYSNYNWASKNKQSIIISNPPESLFYLYRETAEKTDDYPSDDVRGEEGNNPLAQEINSKYVWP